MTPFKGKALSWHLSEGVIELAMHLPPANEMGSTMLNEFDQFVRELESANNDAGVMIVYSELKAGFSAGGDLREMYSHLQKAIPADADALVRESLRRSHRRLNTIDELPMVTIAAVHGVCFGGGFELALACDLIIADKMARFCFPELRLGLIPGGGGIPRLKRSVGNSVVRDLLLTGRSINAEKAFTVGLVSQLAAEGKVLELARSAASQINKLDASARIAAKRFIKVFPKEDMEREMEIFAQLFVQPAVREGLRRFAESSDPLPYLP